MSNVLIFQPKHDFELQKNYEDFITFAKHELTLFGNHEYKGLKGWECDKWSWVSSTGQKLSIVFE